MITTLFVSLLTVGQIQLVNDFGELEIADADKYRSYKKDVTTKLGKVGISLRIAPISREEVISYKLSKNGKQTFWKGRPVFGQNELAVIPDRRIQSFTLSINGSRITMPSELWNDVVNVRLMPCLGMNPPRGNVLVF